MSEYVLVHGAWMGGWCWERVSDFLTARGHKVVAPDLPGHGQDQTPLHEIGLLKLVNRVCEVLDHSTEPVILVGHSLAGVVISQAAEFRPDRVGLLVYVAAYLVDSGKTAAQLTGEDHDSLLRAKLIVNPFTGRYRLRPESLPEVLYNDCAPEDMERISQLTAREEALAPAMTPVQLTAQNFGRIPRVYIQCLQDRTISPALQRRMCAALPCQRVISMNAAHCPHLSTPAELAAHLDQVAAERGSATQSVFVPT